MPPPALPSNRRIDHSKVEDYLLHPVKGHGKAQFFQRCGFSRDLWQALRAALFEQAVAGQIINCAVSPFGERYGVRGGLPTPDGRHPPPMICTFWQAESGDDGVRLITAYPD